jgi:hypothetical protein
MEMVLNVSIYAAEIILDQTQVQGVNLYSIKLP